MKACHIMQLHVAYCLEWDDDMGQVEKADTVGRGRGRGHEHGHEPKLIFQPFAV